MMIRKREEKSCSVCSEKILVSAIKCKYCGSYQSWGARRYQFSQSFIALIVSVFALLATSYPLLKKLMTPDDSIVRMRYINRPDTTIPLIVSNLGGRPAIIFPAAGLKIIYSNGQGKIIKQDFILVPSDDSRGNLLIESKSSKEYYFVIDVDRTSRDLPDEFKQLGDNLKGLLSIKKCILNVSIQNFNGTQVTTPILIFDTENPVPVGRKIDAQNIIFYRILGADECLGKIPAPIRQKYHIID